MNKIKNLIKGILNKIGFELVRNKYKYYEIDRLNKLKRAHFAFPAFPILKAFKTNKSKKIFQEIRKQKKEIIKQGCIKDYQINNNFYFSPDAEVCSAIVCSVKPKQIIEIGSGNSTKLLRAILKNNKICCNLTCVDPDPRIDIKDVADQVTNKRFEDSNYKIIINKLNKKDILFIDSSHEIKPANDVVKIILDVLPKLKSGVIIHIHDIFLPYEYPKEWIVNKHWPWTEQYLVQALLTGSSQYEVLWAGHYFQKTMPKFSRYFPLWQGKDASSLWLRKK